MKKTSDFTPAAPSSNVMREALTAADPLLITVEDYLDRYAQVCVRAGGDRTEIDALARQVIALLVKTRAALAALPPSPPSNGMREALERAAQIAEKTGKELAYSDVTARTIAERIRALPPVPVGGVGPKPIKEA